MEFIVQEKHSIELGNQGYNTTNHHKQNLVVSANVTDLNDSAASMTQSVPMTTEGPKPLVVPQQQALLDSETSPDLMPYGMKTNLDNLL